MGSFESVVRATQSGNLKTRETECDTDKIGALGFVPKLGSAYIRWTAGHAREDRHTLEIELIKVVFHIARARKWRGTDRIYYSMVALLLSELEHPLCHGCKGRGWVGVDRINPKADAGAARLCPVCNGLKVKKFSPSLRAGTIKVPLNDWNTNWADKFEVIRAALFKACAVTRRELDRQLEREE